MRVLIALLLFSSTAFAEELSISEKHEIELMQIKQQELQKEVNEVVARLRANHHMADGDTWDAQGRIVRAPAPPKKAEPAKK